MNIRNFWTADCHFFHHNLIKYARRPFSSIEEMHQVILTNWNSTVGLHDNVYIVGDVSFGKPDQTESILKQLNGNLFLIRGNHDKQITGHLNKYFCWIKDLAEIYINDSDHPHEKQKIVMCHYAMKVWNQSHYSSWHLFGHSHGTMPDDPNSLSIDVGMDCFNYTPVSYDQIKEIMKKKTFVPIDRHGRNKSNNGY